MLGAYSCVISRDPHLFVYTGGDKMGVVEPHKFCLQEEKGTKLG